MPVPNQILNLPRRLRAEVISPTPSIDLTWPVFDAEDIAVYKDGARMTAGFTVTGTFGASAPALDGAVVFDPPVENCVLRIVDRRPPRREAQFQEGVGVPAVNRNYELNQLAASLRDVWDEFGGKVFEWRGEYNAEIGYEVGDVVVRDGSTWVCLMASIGIEPPMPPVVENETWHLLARRGDAGGLEAFSYLDFPEIGTPSNPAADTVRVFARDVGGAAHVIIVDSAGSEIDLTAANLPFPAGAIAGRGVGAGTGPITPLAPAEARAAAGAASISVSQQFTGNQRMGVTALPAPSATAGTITPDLNQNNLFTLEVDQNFTLANPINQAPGQSGSVRIQQDATGGRMIAWGSHWLFPTGIEPALSTTPNAIDRLDYLVWEEGEIHAALAKGIG